MAGLFRLNTINLGSAGSEKEFTFDKFPVGHLALGLLLRWQYPIDISGGPAGTPTLINFNNLLSAAIQSFTLKYGDRGQYVPYLGVPGQEMRAVHRFVERTEIPNNWYNTSQVNGTGQFAKFDLFVPFAVKGLKNGRNRLPGWSQMRTMRMKVTEGAALNQAGNFANAGTAIRTPAGITTIDIDVMTVPSPRDQWSPILSYMQGNPSDLEFKGPAGLHVGAWDINNAFSGTPYTLWSLAFGDLKMQDGVPPYLADSCYVDEWAEGSGFTGWDQGAASGAINDTYTVVHSPSDNMGTEDLPHGAFYFRQLKQDAAQIKMRGLYWPDIDANEAHLAVKVAATQHAEPVLLQTHPAASESTTPLKHVSTLPLQVHPASEPGFTLKTGLWTVPNSDHVNVSIPEHVAQQGQQAVESAAKAGAEVKTAAAQHVTESLARQVPAAVHSAGASATKVTPKALSQAIGNLGVAGTDALAAARTALAKMLG